MILSNSDIHYMTAILAKLAKSDTMVESLDIPTLCPECGEPANYDDAHIALESDDDDTRPLILIGCEGYHTVDPTLIGLPSGNWGKYRA